MSPRRATRTSFQPKEGEPFDARLNVPFHRYLLIEAGSLLRPGDSLADFVRAAVREKIRRDSLACMDNLLGMEKER